MKPVVDAEFQALIPPLAPEERTQLEQNILAHGCRDPLVVWHEGGVLLDGHNRLSICEAHGIEYRTVSISLPDRDAAADWMDANQLGRRNLTPDQASLLRGRRYNRAKKAVGRPSDKLGKSCPISTAEALSKQHGVSERTIKNDGQFAQAVEKIKAVEPGIERRVTSGDAPPRSAVVQAARLLETAPERAEAILRGEKKTADVIREIKREAVISRLEDVDAREAKAAEGVYDVLVIDPPWPMQKIERDVAPNQTAFDYPTMTEQEMAELELPAADDCHVWLWTTHKFLPMSLRLLEAWGLKYVCTFVWHKPGGFQPFGLPQYNCEFAIYARRGTPQFIDTKAFPTAFNAPRGAHSEKPEEFYEVVRRVTAGRRLDMFNRRLIDGFDGWGKEAEVAA
jgi:N6-adenosine-specific RNA methylase IME4